MQLIFCVHIIALFHLPSALSSYLSFVLCFSLISISVLSIRFTCTRCVSIFGLNFNPARMARTCHRCDFSASETFRLKMFQVPRMDFVHVIIKRSNELSNIYFYSRNCGMYAKATNILPQKSPDIFHL